MINALGYAIVLTTDNFSQLRQGIHPEMVNRQTDQPASMINYQNKKANDQSHSCCELVEAIDIQGDILI
ncbi:MAG: hypothetical protein AB9834_13425 [Lentimicrobium sp.]